MAEALEEVLIASALESLDIEDYWPAFDSTLDLDTAEDEDCDGEYPVILLFYETLLDHMLSTNLVSDDCVQASISYLMRNYSRTVNGKTPDNLDYNDLNNCFAYIHRYAGCHTALVRNVLKRVFHVTPPVAIKRILSLKDSLDVISLGGGPGNDLVGFCSALYGKHYGFLRMNLTIIDRMSGWATLFNKTERMLRYDNFGNASALFRDVQVRTLFHQADLIDSVSWSSNLKNKLQNADIFLLVKVLSVVPDTEKVQLLQNIVTMMKPGAVLIYIDMPFPSKSFTVVEKWLDCVYYSEKKKFQYNYEVKRFGYPNITASQAFVRVYVKKFMVLNS